MTTLGKILVFLVFVAALGMGGLMLYVAKTTPKWADAVKERDDKITVYKAMLDQEGASRQKLVRENEKLKQLLDANLIESKAAQARLKLDVEDKQKQVKEAELQRDKSELNHKQAQMEATRLQKELAFLQTVVQEREQKIVGLLADIATARTAEQAAKNTAETASNRAQSLYAILKEKEAYIRTLVEKSLPGTAAATGPRDHTYRNPPPVYVLGKVEQVDDKDSTLVKISIGSDSGIRKDHTLEVYRVSPKAEYLGRLLVVDADFRHALGRLLRQPGVPPPTLAPGDEVASKLRP
jgi:chromosome segregation ATPase